VVFAASLVVVSNVTDLFKVTIDTILVLAIKDKEETGGKNLTGNMAEAFGVEVR